MTVHVPNESDYGGDWQYEPIRPGTVILTPQVLADWPTDETEQKEQP